MYWCAIQGVKEIALPHERKLDEFNNQIFAYSFDIPFEETLNRHKLKPYAHEFGEKELREWWNEKDLLDIIPEVILHKELRLNEILDIIYRDVIKNKNV